MSRLERAGLIKKQYLCSFPPINRISGRKNVRVVGSPTSTLLYQGKIMCREKGFRFLENPWVSGYKRKPRNKNNLPDTRTDTPDLGQMLYIDRWAGTRKKVRVGFIVVSKNLFELKKKSPMNQKILF
ncbi:unnamed protein product [Meloidogyne enterolobii]|uniref:Uncharacterized protein n=1 Tax=Meloidogyne enterolobii TaxID=390850 RepID=A0ACB0Z0U5_MELEN